MKRLLLIMNPAAGTKKANPHLPEILSVFGRAGYECTVFMTQKRVHAEMILYVPASQFKD